VAAVMAVPSAQLFTTADAEAGHSGPREVRDTMDRERNQGLSAGCGARAGDVTEMPTK